MSRLEVTWDYTGRLNWAALSCLLSKSGVRHWVLEVNEVVGGFVSSGLELIPTSSRGEAVGKELGEGY